jgi:2,4-dienoyl-CoA reductase-like NADH-dependent reductase (Old Yellow Enzyme family)
MEDTKAQKKAMAMGRFDDLSAPVTFRGMELRNRIVMPAISTNCASKEGQVTEAMNMSTEDCRVRSLGSC